MKAIEWIRAGDFQLFTAAKLGAMKNHVLRATLAATLAGAALIALAGCASIHEPKISGEIDRGSTAAVSSQLSYARAHFKAPNSEEFGDLGGTDCVNFTSQTLLARGWAMTAGWKHELNGSNHDYTRPWISSTGFRDYLIGHTELAKPLTWSQRADVAVGDVVQFDWDASGDRDHTAIISGIATDPATGEKVLLVSSHSPGAFDWPIKDVLAEHGTETQVYFWHLLK